MLAHAPRQLESWLTWDVRQNMIQPKETASVEVSKITASQIDRGPPMPVRALLFVVGVMTLLLLSAAKGGSLGVLFAPFFVLVGWGSILGGQNGAGSGGVGWAFFLLIVWGGGSILGYFRAKSYHAWIIACILITLFFFIIPFLGITHMGKII